MNEWVFLAVHVKRRWRAFIGFGDQQGGLLYCNLRESLCESVIDMMPADSTRNGS